jgi:hypothetical protein
MPNTDATGKQGRSMDTSQLLAFRKKYMVVQQQGAKTPVGNQKQKHAFNSDRLGGGGSENGASWYYNQGGNTLIYQRFFGNGSQSQTTNNDSEGTIDPRFSEFAALANKYALSIGNPTVVSVIITSVTANSITYSSALSNGQSASQTTALTTTIPNPLVTDGPTYLNDTGSPVTVTTSAGKTRTYSDGQFFQNDSFLIDQYDYSPSAQ